MTPAPPTLHLVDASMYVFRAWHSMPDEFHDADGWPTNAVHGFARFLLELLERERPRHVAIAFDEALADAATLRFREREPNPAEGAIDKLRSRFLLPPLTLAVIANLGPDDKIPASERFSTASCVCLLLLQAAQAEGYGAQWLTGWPAYDRRFLENTLGLAADEQLVGTIAIGTAQVDVPERERPDPRELLQDWPSP